MGKAKNANDLNEIISEQIDRVTARGAKGLDIVIADSVANMIGKLLKLAALQIKYRDYVSNGGEKIDILENRSGKPGGR